MKLTIAALMLLPAGAGFGGQDRPVNIPKAELPRSAPCVVCTTLGNAEVHLSYFAGRPVELEGVRREGDSGAVPYRQRGADRQAVDGQTGQEGCGGIDYRSTSVGRTLDAGDGAPGRRIVDRDSDD